MTFRRVFPGPKTGGKNPTDGFVLRAGWLIDGQGGPALRDRLILIQNGRVVRIELYMPQAVNGKPFIDCSAATILPPLVDCHVHLAYSGSRDPQVRSLQTRQAGDTARNAIAAHLVDHFQNGVFAVRDGGDRNGDVLRHKQKQQDQPDGWVSLVAAGPAWHAPGRYGRMIGRVLPHGRQGLSALATYNADCNHFKLINSGMNSLDQYGKETAPQFSPVELRAIVAVAQKAGKPVMVHANGRGPVSTAVAAGCSSIEHGYFMGRDNLLKMADRGVFWVPTAVPMAALADSPNLTDSQREVARRTLQAQLRLMDEARAAGVRICLGTDAGSVGVNHGRAVRRELALLVQSGMSLEAAVQAATQSAAQLLGLHRCGVLSCGRPAELVVLPGPPEMLLQDHPAFAAAFTRGCWLSRDAQGAWTLCWGQPSSGNVSRTLFPACDGANV